MEKMYKLIDLQLGDVEIRPKEFIVGYAFGIMEDRSEAVDDELGQEFAEIVSKGKENFTFDMALEILNLWEYKVERVN
jgi:hypothetical protein